MINADDATRAPAETTLIFLGDLVDRGPDSAGVVERLLTLSQQRPRVRFLKGNHEELFLHALDGAKDAAISRYPVTRSRNLSMLSPSLAFDVPMAPPKCNGRDE